MAIDGRSINFDARTGTAGGGGGRDDGHGSRRRRRDEPLAASVGLVDADLVAMYRTVALARAVDERMWIRNRAGGPRS